MMVDLDLNSHYTINHNLKKHGYSLEELEDITPIERIIYISLLERDVREKNEQIRRQNLERQMNR